MNWTNAVTKIYLRQDRMMEIEDIVKAAELGGHDLFAYNGEIYFICEGKPYRTSLRLYDFELE